MYNLYFIRHNGEKVLVKEYVEFAEGYRAAKEYVQTLNPNFTIHYVRTWGEDPIIIDVGSHTEFFHMYKVKLGGNDE